MKFEKIESSQKITEVLTTIKESGLKTFIWKLGPNGKEIAEVRLQIIRKKRNELVFIPVGNIFQVEKILSGTEQINIFIVDDVMLFQSQLIRVEMDYRFTVAIPEKILLMERRRSLRLQVDDSIGVKSKIVLERGQFQKCFHKSIFDISEKGLSFFINNTEKKDFHQGEVICHVELILPNESIVIAGKIVNISPVDSSLNPHVTYDCYKVGIEFIFETNKLELKVKEVIFSFHKELSI